MKIQQFWLSVLFLILLFLSAVQSFAVEKTQIQLWHMMIYSHRQVLQKLVDDFQKQNPNIAVQVTYRETEELRSAYQAAAMGGSGPELIYGPSDQVGPFATMGIIQPLEAEFPQQFWSQFDPLSVVQYQNHTYQLGDSVGNHLMLIYNKKMVKTPPKNTDELIDLGKKLTHEDQYGLVFNFTEPFFFVPWVTGFGEHFITENGEPRLNTEAAKNAFNFMLILRDSARIIPRECDYELANALFKEGKAAMIINGDWSWGDYQKAGVDFGVARIPMVSTTKKWPAPLVGTKGYSLNINTKDPNKKSASLKLIEFLTSQESQLRFASEVGTLPSSKAARSNPIVVNNPLLKESADIMSVGRPMPIIPEVRAIWDTLRGQYQSVLAATTDAPTAAKTAQINAEKQIREMNEVLEPNWQVYIVYGIVILFVLLILKISIPATKEFIKGMRGPSQFAYLMMLPAFAAIFAVIIYPFFYNLAISVSNFSLRTFQDWQIIGFHHYLSVFAEKQFYYILGKTLLWTILNVSIHVVLGVFLAVLINQTLPAKAFWRVLLIIPWAVPQYITALTWRGLFNQEYGPINLFLTEFLHLSPVQWLSQPWTAFTACVITNVWLGFPFMMVVSLGGLQSISNSLYEAARIDGANAWQRFTTITWPLLQPVLRPAAVLGCIWTFNSLNVVWLVSNSGEPADQTHILVSYVYKSAFNLYRYGYAAALSVVIFAILLLMGYSLFQSEKKSEESHK